MFGRMSMRVNGKRVFVSISARELGREETFAMLNIVREAITNAPSTVDSEISEMTVGFEQL